MLNMNAIFRSVIVRAIFDVDQRDFFERVEVRRFLESALASSDTHLDSHQNVVSCVDLFNSLPRTLRTSNDDANKSI